MLRTTLLTESEGMVSVFFLLWNSLQAIYVQPMLTIYGS